VKTSLLSLVIAISVAILSLFQFDRYQTFSKNTQTNLTSLENKTNATLEHFKTDLTTLKTTDEALLTRTQNPSFQTAELEYLVRLANTRLLATRDVKATIALFTLAQTKIQALNDLSLSRLSDAITQDITLLQKSDLPDVTDLWLKVSTVIEQTRQLSPEMIASNANQTKTTEPTSKIEPSLSRTDIWKKRFFESLETIKDLVKIRRSTQAVEPILSETQKNLIQENLRVLLEQIRLAILTNDDKIYQQALQDTQEWLLRYYGNTNRQVQEIQNTLTGLSTIQLNAPLPHLIAIDFFNTVR
jgi:uroporphyrin-3 C-methyltransferase